MVSSGLVSPNIITTAFFPAISIACSMVDGRPTHSITVCTQFIPAPASAESSRVLGTLLERAVPVAAEQIGRFVAAVEEGAPLDPWLDRDFGGMAYRKTDAAPQSAPAW